MNSRWLWNSHRRHKFLKAKASRDILKYRVSEIAFPGFSSSIFHHGRQAVSWAFHVVVVQWRQRNEQKNVMHEQSCCFTLNLFFFCRSRRCRRRRSLLHNRFQCRHATLLPTREERCVTTLKTAVQQTTVVVAQDTYFTGAQRALPCFRLILDSVLYHTLVI